MERVMERMWWGDAALKYPKQWIVMVNIEDKVFPGTRGGKIYKSYGDIYLVTPNAKEAYAASTEIGDSMGTKGVFEGFNDTPMIGGLYV